MNNKLFVNFAQFTFNETVLPWNLTYTAHYKQLPSANDLKRQVITIKVDSQEEVCYGIEIHKLNGNEPLKSD